MSDFQMAADRGATPAGTRSRGLAISHWNKNKLLSALARGLTSLPKPQSFADHDFAIRRIDDDR
jgi:hypothetical protein